MDAVVLAGGIPQANEPLYSYSHGEAKALIDMAGKPMIQWVLDALGASKSIEHVVLIGLSDKAKLACKKPLTYLPNKGKLLENLKAGAAKVVELNPKAEYVLFVSSDIPSITSEMVDWLIATCKQTDDDLYYNVVRREDMERVFPGSRRTYTRLKDLAVCGGDMNMARASIVDQNSEFVSKLLDARKNPAAQAALIGPDIIFKYLFGQLTVDDVVQRVADKLGWKGRAIVCPYPEVGMDVDKPHQLELMREHLERRSRRPSSTSAKPKPKPAPAKKAAARKTAKPTAQSTRKTGTRTKS